jgi:hypothetical protein
MPRYKDTNKCFRQPNQPANDECYTPIKTVYEELSKWAALGKFKDKKIICPCDTSDSAFVKVLTENKEAWGIKSITYSHIDDNIDCLEIDYSKYNICITNPPFSLYKVYLPILLKSGIDFLMIAPYIDRGSVFCRLLNNKTLKIGFGRHLPVKFNQPDNKKLHVAIDWITTWPEAQEEVNKREFITVSQEEDYEVMENMPEKPIICKPWKTLPPNYDGWCFCSISVLDKLPQDKYEWRIIKDMKLLKHNNKNCFSGVILRKTRSKS